MTLEELKQEILGRVKEYYKLKFGEALVFELHQLWLMLF